MTAHNADRRDIAVNIRVNEAEMVYAQACARWLGCSVSEVFRRQLMKPLMVHWWASLGPLPKGFPFRARRRRRAS